jgi:hypothetical protein
VGYRRGTPHGLQKNGRAPRGGLHAASRQLQARYAMARRSVHLVRVSVAPCGEMVGIYRYVAVVYHLAHLGPRYASTSCQVILFCSLSTSMAPPGLVSSAGLFDWTLRLDSRLDLDLDLDLKCTRSRVVLSFLGIVVAHRLSRAPNHPIQFRQVFRRQIVSRSSSHSHEAWMKLHILASRTSVAVLAVDAMFLLHAQRRWGSRVLRKRRSQGRVPAQEAGGKTPRSLISCCCCCCCCACIRCRKRGLDECSLGGPV